MKNNSFKVKFNFLNTKDFTFRTHRVLFLFTLFAIAFSIADAQEVLLSNDDFETSFGNWVDGDGAGDRCIRSNNNLLGGNFNVRLRNGGDLRSSITSNSLDLTPYGQLAIRMNIRFTGYENGETLTVQYNSGGGFTNTIATFTVGSGGITNNRNYTVNLTMSRSVYTFGANSQFRIRGNGNQNNDVVRIDNIVISGSLIPPNDECSNAISLTPNPSCENTIGSTRGATESLPGCSGTADDDVWYSFVATNTEHTVRVAGSALDMAFQIFEGSCAGTSLICENSNNNSLPEETTFTTLTIGNTYYVRVYTVSNNARFNGNFSICIIEPCTSSTANGTSELACPSVDAGGVGLSGSDVTINCSVGSTNIEANFLDLGETSNYDVESIAYVPPFQFNCLANPVSVNIDDRWSPVVNLPFDFCFFGNTYNSCVIGSNGVISFDTSLANSYSGWRISNNIPSNVNADNSGGLFFGPSIYGVYHDVDPSVGGEIGYQLITLDSGCQALVAAWSDVPMFADNSKLYTGMIVFYEDTNVIEVYIKEKQTVNGWNGGNATVGLQEDATNAVVAPGRNSLNTNWTTTNEAWRFTPNGTSITELKWYEGFISPANEIIDPNDDGEITVSPDDTTTYFAEVTYSLCNGTTKVETDNTTVTVTGKKTWNGSVDTAWENPNNWTPIGIPTLANCVTIPNTGNDPIMASTTNGTGYNLEIDDGATLTQLSNSTLTIEDVITIEPNGDLEIEDDASVIQISDLPSSPNTGSARVQREVTGVDYFDYVYWSSPVDVFDVENISPGTPNFAIFKWIPSVVGTTGQHGTWANTSEDMILGKGYIVRGLLGGSIPNTAEFQGTLNNGLISTPISRWVYTGSDYMGTGNIATADDDNWNLIGNPYPSAISLSDFVTANPAINGTLYFWRHLTPINSAVTNPFYENYTYNYSPSDYLAENGSGSVPAGFGDNLIAAGQGFFALMLDSEPTPSTVTFSNSMRGTYDNSGFFRNNTSNVSSEKHRIWLDLVSESSNTANSILIGFIEGATDDLDRLYDGYLLNRSNQQFYSIISDKELIINGKGLPFDDSDTANLGYKAENNGSFNISINSLDGLFDSTGQDIYIEDTELNIIHDLRTSPYSFTSDQGTFNERFILRFNNNSLSVNNQDALSSLKILASDNTINTISPKSNIKTFELFDLLGKSIHRNISINDRNYRYTSTNLSKGAYIVKVSLENGAVVSKKIVL